MGLYLLEWLCVCKVSDCQSTTFIYPFAELGIATSRPGSKQCMTQKLPFSISTPSSQCTLQVRCFCDMVGSMASLSLLSNCCDSNGLTEARETNCHKCGHDNHYSSCKKLCRETYYACDLDRHISSKSCMATEPRHRSRNSHAWQVCGSPGAEAGSKPLSSSKSLSFVNAGPLRAGGRLAHRSDHS